jgi:NADH-quinone oxidoreductase subunit A
MGSQYAPIVVVLFLAVSIPIAFLLLTTRLGPRKPEPGKLAPYESGVIPARAARDRVPVKFYLIAVLFLLFDVEAVFLFPWAVARKGLGTQGEIGIGIFLLILVLGLAYEWRKGGMEWE